MVINFKLKVLLYVSVFKLVELEVDFCNVLVWFIFKINSDNVVEVIYKFFCIGWKVKWDVNIVVFFVIVFCVECDR